MSEYLSIKGSDVLIVAKCIVNSIYHHYFVFLVLVLIVAKCIVNFKDGSKELRVD